MNDDNFTNASVVKTPFILNDLDKEILNKIDFRVYESFRGFVNGRTSFLIQFQAITLRNLKECKTSMTSTF